jgi:peptidoglycan/LPS O-acetylase OafA/YrhL
MKKGIAALMTGVFVLIATALWLVSTDGILRPYDALSFGVIIIVVGFALFFGYKRITSARRGEPAEDEMSKKILQRTAALSYYISLYLWVAILFIRDKISLDTEELIGAGIMGMAITFALCWIVLYFRGIRNE